MAYRNINGNLTTEEFAYLVKLGKVDLYLKRHFLTTHKCPPLKLLEANTNRRCFYCVDCFRYCESRVKVLKSCIKVLNEKFKNTDEVPSSLIEELDRVGIK